MDKSEVVVYDEYVGSGYGEPTEDMIKALNLLLELITDVEAVDFAIATGEAIYVPWITVKNNVLV